MSEKQDRVRAVPFVKWVGGKRWLVNKYSWLFPKDYKTYREPFLGGGAVLFHLNPKTAVASDLNSQLIDVYRAIKKDWRKVLASLELHQSKHSEKHYYRTRDSSEDDRIKEAVRFLYLNRSCFNGIYRVNRFGQFNVPKGSKTQIVMEDDDFEAVSRVIQRFQFKSEDFEVAIDRAEKGDFVFVDPPYTVKHNNNGFVKYNQKLFSWDDQIRLRDCVRRAKLRGVMTLVTNANHASVRELYAGLGTLHELTRASVLAASSDFRGGSTELAVTIGYNAQPEQRLAMPKLASKDRHPIPK